MKRLLILSACIILYSQSKSQDLTDAYRYSNNIYTGSARFAGMAGSLGALGGDFSSVSVNPAGLGVYRTNDFMFTPSFNYNKTTSSYLGTSSEDNRFVFGISNIGLVTTFKNPSQSSENGMVSFNFGIGYNKLKDFNSNVFTAGRNKYSSITDQFVVDANWNYSTNPDDLTIKDGDSPFDTEDWLTVMAWNTFLIDSSWNDIDKKYEYRGPLKSWDAVSQSLYKTTRGSMGEYVLSFAGNYADKFYFGATLGIQDLYYKSNSIYTERGDDTSSSGFNNMYYKQNLETFGTGVNLKLGLIYKPIHELRLGVAFHTPTLLNLRDKYSYSMGAKFNYGLPVDPVFSPKGEFDYNIVTPYRLIGSVGGLLLDKIAFNIEYELVDYSLMRLREDVDPETFHYENNTISRMFGVASNVRTGIEYHQGPLFVRGGYAYYGSPIKAGELNSNSKTQLFALGFGIRTGTFYTDFAYNRTIADNEYIMYGDQDLVKVKDKNTQTQFIVTLGYKF